MSTSPKNLKPGQYQIGELVFGRGTLYPVESVEIQSYEVNAQDYQLIRSDETRFGQDNFVAAPIVFAIGVDDNYALDAIAGLTGVMLDNIDASKFALHALAREWRGDDVKGRWGQTKPLYCCERDGRVLMIYGRPRKFQYTKRSRNSQFFKVNAEFQRGDTMAYGSEEQIEEIFLDQNHTIVQRDAGDVSSWFRLLLIGPLNHPIITIGNQQVDLDYNIPDGSLVEVSSYPWSRRVIDDNGTNLAAKLIGDTQYLDQLRLPPNLPIPVRWTDSTLKTWVPELDEPDWLVDVGVPYFKLPNTFTTITGKVVVRFDLISFGIFPLSWNPGRFIASSLFNDTSAVVYNKKKFATANQYSQCEPVAPFNGKSAMAIMSTDTMSSFVCVNVEKVSGQQWLRIHSGTAPDTTTVRASWQNLSDWKETDVIAIKYDWPALTYRVYMNEIERATWKDGDNEVQTVTITGTPTSGFFKLTYDGQQTIDIAHNAVAAAVQSALEGLSNIAVGDVSVAGGPGPGTPYVVTFQRNLGGQNLTEMTASHTLGGGSSPNVAVTTTTNGVAPVVPTGSLNRTQGFIFDMDGNVAGQGTGFKHIIAYDTTIAPAQTGQVLLLWRDAYSAIA